MVQIDLRLGAAQTETLLSALWDAVRLNEWCIDGHPMPDGEVPNRDDKRRSRSFIKAIRRLEDKVTDAHRRAVRGQVVQGANVRAARQRGP